MSSQSSSSKISSFPPLSEDLSQSLSQVWHSSSSISCHFSLAKLFLPHHTQLIMIFVFPPPQKGEKPSLSSNRDTRSILSSETSPAPRVRPQPLTHIPPPSFLTVLSSSAPTLYTYLKGKHFATLISCAFYSQNTGFSSQIDSLGFHPTTSPLFPWSPGPDS